MNKFLLGVFAAAALIAAGCKTTEANYKAAYDAAIATRQTNPEDGLDDNTRRLLAMDRLHSRSKVITAGDTLDIIMLAVKMESESPKSVPQYSVVANAFSQIFNARALQKRLIEAGFVDAYIFKTSAPDYYVAAGGSNDISAIPQILKHLEDAGNPGSRAGFPAVIKSLTYKP